MVRMSLIFLILSVVEIFVSNGFALNDIPIESKIVNGQNSTRGQFPFYAFLKISVFGTTSFCGGSLISPKFVVTAAHCVESFGVTSVEVHLGSMRANNLIEEGRVIVNVTSRGIHVHPRFDPEELLK